MASAQESEFDQMKGGLNESSLPLVNLIVDIEKVNRSNYVEGQIEIADYWRRTDSSSDTVRYFCKFRYRGASASTYAKKSFAVKLIDEAGEDFDANIFGIREENSWILDAMAIDRIRMRNRICFDVWNDMSRTPYDTKYDNRNGTEGVFVEVFINGNYQGLYCMTDKIDRKLLGLKKAKVDEDGEVAVRGLLYKGISWGSAYNLLSYQEADTGKDTWNAWELQYPDDYPSIDTWQPLMDLIDFCSDKTTTDQFMQDYESYFYSENLVDYVVFTLALNVGDNAYKNTFLSTVDKTKGHRYLVSPWDMDMSLGGHWDGKYNESLANPNRYNGIAPFNRLIVQNMDGFKDNVAARWGSLYSTLFSLEAVNGRLEYYANMFIVSGAWDREVAKWNGNPVPLKESLRDELEYVEGWYAKNYAKLCNHFGTDITGIVQVSAPQTPDGIYTLDGRKISARSVNQLAKGLYIVKGCKIFVR